MRIILSPTRVIKVANLLILGFTMLMNASLMDPLHMLVSTEKHTGSSTSSLLTASCRVLGNRHLSRVLVTRLFKIVDVCYWPALAIFPDQFVFSDFYKECMSLHSTNPYCHM